MVKYRHDIVLELIRHGSVYTIRYCADKRSLLTPRSGFSFKLLTYSNSCISGYPLRSSTVPADCPGSSMVEAIPVPDEASSVPVPYPSA